MIKTYGFPKVDRTDWSIVTFRCEDGYEITDRTLLSEDYYKAFCEKYGYEFVSFEKGTNEYCA